MSMLFTINTHRYMSKMENTLRLAIFTTGFKKNLKKILLYE